MNAAKILLFSVCAMVSCAGEGLCQDEAQKEQQVVVYSVAGKISNINWVRSEIAVKWYDRRRGRYDEIVLFVPKRAKIFKYGNQAWLSDIIVGDNVEANYYASPPNPFTVVSLYLN